MKSLTEQVHEYICINDTQFSSEELANMVQYFTQEQEKEIEELKQIVEGTIKQAFYEDDYYKLKAEYDLLKADLEVKKASEK